MNLYELSHQYQNALESLSDMDLPDEVLKDTLEALGGELMDKYKNVALYKQNLMVVAQAKKDAAKSLNDQAKAIENKAMRLMDYLDENMKRNNITEITCPYFTVKYRKNPPSVIIDDESLLPESMVRTKTTTAPDKAAIKKAIQSGEHVAGARVVQNETLTIK